MNGQVSGKLKKEAKYWDKFEKEAAKYGIPIWVDYQKANTPEIPFINFSTDSKIDRLYLGGLKDSIIKRAGTGKILDLGCGAGWLSLELARRGAQVKGIDISGQRIKIAKKHANRENVNIDYLVGDIESLDWVKTNRYDSIVNWNSLHHIGNIEEVLAGIKRSLKKGGLFVSWDHLGDNFLIQLSSEVASGIPGYYKAKVKVLGTIHSEAEGVAEIRLKREVVQRFFKVQEYKNYFAFVPLIPAIYKFIRYKLHVPIPKLFLVISLRIGLLADHILVRIFPALATYSFVVAQKK